MTGNEKAFFITKYHESKDFIRKYRLARDLVIDGRFIKSESLLDNFLHPSVQVPEDQKFVVNSLKDYLHFLLIQKEVLPPESMSEETSERLIIDELRRKQDYQDLIADGFHIEVVGQLMAVDLFSEISDAKKLEEYRAWVTKALFREFMGVLSGKTTRRELAPVDIMARIPHRIFADPDQIKYHLTRHAIEERLMRTVTHMGVNEGLAALDQLVENTLDSDKKIFLGDVVERFYKIATEPDDPQFNSTIYLKGQPKHFPSFEQMACCHDFEEYGTRLVAAGTGLGKTGTAFKMIAKSKATHTLVLVPANGRETWSIEERKLFREPGNVKVITGAADIDQAIKERKRFTVVSYELLSRAKKDPILARQLDRLVDEIGINGGIADEIDELSNHKIAATQTTKRLFEKIRQNYSRLTGESQFDAPIIGLTATPIRSRLSDLNVTMALLYPDRYVMSHDEVTESRKTFSGTHVNRPDLGYYTLVGEKRMFRWEQGEGVQGFEYEPVEVEISPFEELLYAFIANEVPTGTLDNIRILEDCLVNPLLIKAEVRKLARSKIVPLDIDYAINTLVKTVEAWKEMKNISEPTDETDFLSADRLVELGLGDIVLSCFFSDLCVNGIDTLVDKLTKASTNPHLIELRNFWKPSEISTKYAKLRELTQESLTWITEPDGTLSRQKVVIVSPSRKQGRTGNVLQKQVEDVDGEKTDLYSESELDVINDSILITHLKEWVKDYCDPATVLLIDGTVGVGKSRDAVISRWVDEPDYAAILTTLEATYQSRDYTLNKIIDSLGRAIRGVTKILISPPWNNQQLQQIAGRDRRQGQLIPVDLKILLAKGLFDQGKAEAVMYTYLLSRVALSGMVLSKEQQAFFDSKRVGNRIQLQNPEARFLRDTFAWIRGAGENRIRDYFRQPSVLGESSKGQLFAEQFYAGGRDAYRLTGYNAELEAYLTKLLVSKDSRILSVGAGSLLYQRKLQRGVDNVDINPLIMSVAWEEASQYGGRTIEAAASALSEVDFPSGSYKLVESAFALDMSSLNNNIDDSDRVRILSQVNRVLEQNGYLILTLPEKSFDDRRFDIWIEALEKHFGLEIDRDRSGKSFGRSKMGVAKRLGWCIIGKKIGDVNMDGLILKNLEFANENGEWISAGPKKKKKTKGFQGRDYPTPDFKIEFDQYEIINNSQERIIILDSDGSEIPINGDDILNGDDEDTSDNIPTPTKELLDLDYLRGSGNEDYIEYRESLLKPIMKLTKLRWEDAEELCANIFMDVQKRKSVSSRLVAYSYILRDIRKQSRRKGVRF